MWDWFIQLLYHILEGIESFCGDWGLAIILLTFIIRILLTPLQTKSIKSSAQMQILQPRIKEIQELYGDDPLRQQEEMRKIYQEHKFNPLGGCLPLLLQMPVFFALFTVLRQLLPPEACFYQIFPSLADTVSGKLASGGIGEAWVYILFDILFGVLTFIPMMINMKSSPQTGKTTMVMGFIMAGMMIFFGWGVPVGVLLYYNTSAAWGIIQQLTITKHMMDKYKRESEEKLRNAPVQVNVVRREQKQRPKKKGKK